MFLDNEFYTAYAEDLQGYEWKIEVSCIITTHSPDDWEITQILHLQGSCEELDIQTEMNEQDLDALGIDMKDVERQVLEEYAQDIGV